MTIKYLDSKRIQTSAEGTYGSGGGSGGAVTSGNPTGTAGQGNSGGYGTGNNGNGGGGGGSSSAGTNGSLSSGVGSDGGSGTNNNWTTGSNVGYAGGGAGGHANNTGGSGTATHGAHAGAYPNNVADANSGAGGSAGDSMTENSQVYGGTGGSGIVVVRYLTSGAPTVVSSVTPSTVGSYTVHKFISTGSFQITSGSTSADILVVGGGGSGGTRRHGGGGGAGGYIETLSKSLGVDTYTITIGAGGASTQSTDNVSGSDGTYSAFDDGGGDEIKAKGGGKGGGYDDAGGGGTSPATKPTNVETNSILVEKDTGNRYWFDGSYWSPKFPTVAGLKLHLDASDLSTITKDGSNLVSAWNDKSGQANHVTQATGSNQPLWVNQVQDTLPVIRFDGVNDSISSTSFVGGNLSQPNTIFIVCTFDSDNYTTIFDSQVAGVTRHVFQNSTGDYQLYAGSAPTFGTVTTALAQYTALFNTSASEVRRNKTSIGSSLSIGSFPLSGIRIGMNSSGDQAANIDVCEMLIYNADVSDADRDLIEDYLIAKWGL